jgi:dienelactone hydrolase
MSKSRVGLALLVLLTTVFSPFSLEAAGQKEFLDLPRPLGTYAVGTRTFVLADSNRKRDLIVTTWFPAVGGSAVAPYMDRRTADELAREWKLQTNFEEMVRTNSRLDATVAEGSFPVVFLEHGSGVVPATYTALAEGLSSHGFVVIAINHPPDSLIAAYPDGHEIKSKPYWPLDADRRTQGLAIGKFADEVLVPDVRFVLDRLQRFNLHEDFWHGHLDLSRVGIVGHSMGGTTAALATLEESRILAGVNLDGSTFPGMNRDIRPIQLHKPLLFIATEEHASDSETHAKEYAGSAENTYYIVVAGSDHMGFSDARLLQSRFSQESASEAHSHERALLTIELTRCLVEEFLGKYLKGSLAPTLDSVIRIERK